MKNAIVTYIYPNAVKYIPHFLKKLLNQTNKKFELIIFNDQVHDFELPFTNFKVKSFNVSGTPIEIRIKSFKILKNLNFENYIFIDIDDLMSNNRIEIIEKKLNENSIVCNDLNLITENGYTIKKKVWKNRLVNNFIFNYEFIRDQNIIGFGNVALKKEILKNNLKFSKIPKIGDWFVFYQLLKINNVSCLFTSECQTNYRQHSNNQIGLQEISDDKWENTIKIARLHYKGLIEIGLEKKIPKFKRRYKTIKESDNKFPFWWEEIQIKDEKN
jgi:hypothetical protein